MSKIIKPIDKLPNRMSLGGDYEQTQSALMLSAIAGEDVRISNYHRGKDTELTISFLRSIGRDVNRNALEINIFSASAGSLSECESLSYQGGVLPLTLIIGYIIGKKSDCTLKYSKRINQDLVDTIVGFVNKLGIDLLHEADEYLIIYRAGRLIPIEGRLDSLLPYLKNLLLMAALTGDIPILLKEEVSTARYFERVISKFGGHIDVYDTKLLWKDDPKDPRKRIQIPEADYRREIKINRNRGISGGDIELPADFHSALAVIELAILIKQSFTLVNVQLSRRMNRLLKLLEVMNAGIDLSNRRAFAGDKLADLTVHGARLKGRKISGDTAQVLIEEMPFIAAMSAFAKGTTVIRDIKDYACWSLNPFVEIAKHLGKLNVKAGAIDDGLIIEGISENDETDFGPFVNHDIALAFYMIALSGKTGTTFEDFEILMRYNADLVEALDECREQNLLSKSES
jgi:3-phosphoshikimate 1-carboxyvinyltransferase